MRKKFGDGGRPLSDRSRLSRVLPMLAAFVAGLVVVFGIVLYVSGGASPIRPAIAGVGSPFRSRTRMAPCSPTPT